MLGGHRISLYHSVNYRLIVNLTFHLVIEREGYNQHIDLKQARFEVRKLGIKGFKGEQKEEAMTSLLLRLGAKVSIAPDREKFSFFFHIFP